MNRILIHILFIAAVLGCGLLIGINNIPGEWYQSLVKPSFNPPNWIFAPAWLALYVLIAIAGWRTFLRNRSGAGMKLWSAQMILNWLWSPVMFGMHLIWPAFGIILIMLAMIVGFIVACRKVDPVASLLFVPYLAWVCFATMLNLSLGLLN